MAADPAQRSHRLVWSLAIVAAVALLAVAGLVGYILADRNDDPTAASVTTTVAPKTTAALGLTTEPSPVATPEPTPEPTTIETPTQPTVILGYYCGDHDAVGVTADGTTAYCSRVARTDAYKWSTSPGVIPNEPVENEGGRPWVPQSAAPTWNQGTDTWTDTNGDGQMQGAERCGTQCGDAPTSGEIQQQWMNCIATHTTAECREILGR